MRAPGIGDAVGRSGNAAVTRSFTIDEIVPRSRRQMVRDVAACHFEDEDRPKLIRLHFTREESIAA